MQILYTISLPKVNIYDTLDIKKTQKMRSAFENSVKKKNSTEIKLTRATVDSYKAGFDTARKELLMPDKKHCSNHLVLEAKEYKRNKEIQAIKAKV